MATIQHSAIADPDIHEPKGVATASAKDFYVANGTGSGSWQQFPYGGVFAMHIGSPLVVTGSGSATTRIDTVETTGALSSSAVEFQANTDGTLEYTGSLTRHIHIACSVSLQKATASSTNGRAVLFKYDASTTTWSEVTHSEVRMEITASSADHSTAIHADVMVDTGDKLVLGIENVSGSTDLDLVTYYLFAMGMPGV